MSKRQELRQEYERTMNGLRRSTSFRSQVRREALSLVSYRPDLPQDVLDLATDLHSRSRAVTTAQKNMVAGRFGPSEVQRDERTHVFRDGDWQQSYPPPDWR